MKSKTLLGLPQKATLEHVKKSYRNLMKKWHPDTHQDKEKATKMSAEINKAYEIIMDYIQNYEYSFEEDYLKEKTQTPQEWWNDKFNNPNR